MGKYDSYLAMKKDNTFFSKIHKLQCFFIVTSLVFLFLYFSLLFNYHQSNCRKGTFFKILVGVGYGFMCSFFALQKHYGKPRMNKISASHSFLEFILILLFICFPYMVFPRCGASKRDIYGFVGGR